MSEIKIEAVSINDGDVAWEISLYSRDIFIETICTCYEKEYVNILASVVAEKTGSKWKECGIDY